MLTWVAPWSRRKVVLPLVASRGRLALPVWSARDSSKLQATRIEVKRSAGLGQGSVTLGTRTRARERAPERLRVGVIGVGLIRWSLVSAGRGSGTLRWRRGQVLLDGVCDPLGDDPLAGGAVGN